MIETYPKAIAVDDDEPTTERINKKDLTKLESSAALSVRSRGSFANYGFYLPCDDGSIDWKIISDEHNVLVLIRIQNRGHGE